MSLIIYGVPALRAVRNHWAEHEPGLACADVPYRFAGPGNIDPAFSAINPNATIPAIVDDGFCCGRGGVKAAIALREPKKAA